jgi:hypothetical protein
VALLRGQSAEALRLAEQAAALGEDGNRAGRCVALAALGSAQLACGLLDAALATFESLIDGAASISMRCRLADGYEGAAAACIALGRVDDARKRWSAAASIRHDTASRRFSGGVVDRWLATAGLD